MNNSAVQAAGMVGEDQVGQVAQGAHVMKVVTYLSRLTGESLTGESPLRLRSLHRAAFMAWARTQAVPIRAEALTSGLCTIRQVLGEGGDEAAVATAGARPVASARASSDLLSVPGGEIGIDLEEVDSLPEASDYRDHSFFRDYFSSAEIAYCIRQPDTRASFCGLWAAKEAILKAGLIPATARLMKEYEIGHDEQGRPIFPSCRLSISHTTRFAVAVCVAAGALPAPVRAERIPAPEQSPPPSAGKKKWPWSSAPQPN